MPDLFPTTHATWLMQTIVDDPPAARSHVMQRYAAPLCAYARASSLRLLGEPEELVNDFLAARVGEASYLERWRGSGLSLRRWLVNGLLTHTRNKALAERRRRTGGMAIDPADIDRITSSNDSNALLALERAWAIRTMTEAHDRVREEFHADGKGAWWDLFRLHSVQGLSYDRACAATGIAPGNASHVNRVVAARLRETVIAILLRDGIPPDEIERELAGMQDALD